MSKTRRSQFITFLPGETRKLGQNLAKEILRKELRKNAVVLALLGDLGGGKTTFLQGFAKGLGVKEKILSPTFIIMRKFQIESGERKVEGRKKTTRHLLSSTLYSLPSTLYHIDCYRVEKPKEILVLGFKKIISDPQNIVAIEWAERLGKILPKNTICLHFDFLDKKTRKITISKNHNSMLK